MTKEKTKTQKTKYGFHLLPEIDQFIESHKYVTNGDDNSVTEIRA